jgi:hypothetical protein
MKLFGKLVIDSITKINNYHNNIDPNEKIFSTEVSLIKPKKENNRYILSEEFMNSNQMIRKRRNKINTRLFKSVNLDSDKFNLLKTVKNIRDSINESNDVLNSKIAYDDQNYGIVFDARKQINNYNKRKANRLTNKDGSLSAFLYEQKHIGINNYIIKNLNEENEKLKNLENEHKEIISKGEINLINKNNTFNECVTEQNSALKKIVYSYNDINEKYRELFIERDQEELIKKGIDDEMERLLITLEELRQSCKFVTKVINIDYGKFDKCIIEKNYKNTLNPNEKPDFGEMTSKVIQDYKFCLKRKKGEEEELFELLDDPNIMIMKFHEIEDRIIRLLEKIEQIQLNIEFEKNEMDNILHEMNERLKFYEIDYKDLQNLVEIEKENIDDIIHTNKKKNSYAVDLIKEIYNNLLQYETNKNKVNKPYHINDITKDCVNKIKNIEIKLNNYISNLEKYELEDENTFINVVTERRLFNKDFKYLEQKRKLEEEREEKKQMSEDRLKKVIIQSRKTEAPFRIVKKIEPVKIIKEEENEDYDYIFY